MKMLRIERQEMPSIGLQWQAQAASLTRRHNALNHSKGELVARESPAQTAKNSCRWHCCSCFYLLHSC